MTVTDNGRSGHDYPPEWGSFDPAVHLDDDPTNHDRTGGDHPPEVVGGPSTPAFTDQPTGGQPDGPVTRGPIIEPWLRDRSERRTRARSWASRKVHNAAWLVARGFPGCWWTLTVQSWRGGQVGLDAWWALATSREERRQLAGVEAEQGVTARRSEAPRWYVPILIFVGVAAAGLTTLVLTVWTVVVAFWPLSISTLVLLLVLSIALPVLGWIGRPADAPSVLDSVRMADADRREQLTEARVLRALSMTLAKIDQSNPDRAATIVAPGLSRVRGRQPGSEVVIDLPEGFTAGQIIEKKHELASALRLPEDTVWPEPVKRSHPGRMRLFVSDEPMSQMGNVHWPHLQTGFLNLFEPVFIGLDQQGQPVSACLDTQGGIMAAKPRMGKTALLRLWGAVVALDTRAELWWYGGKGGGDGVPLERICHRYGSTADIDALAPQVDAELDEAIADMVWRYDRMTELKKQGVISATQVNDALVELEPRLAHKVIIIDECHELFSFGKLGKAITAKVATLAKRGPAVGIIILVATQEPDADAVPTEIRNQLGLRWCFKVMGQPVNDMALGTGAYKAGYNAMAFDDSDKGICWFLKPDGAPVIMRTAFLNDEARGPDGSPLDELEIVIDRAFQARKAAGRLTGHAAGEQFAPDEADTAHLVEDLVDVWPAGEEQLSNYELLALLQGYKPKKYAGWKVGSITSHLRDEWSGYKPVQCAYHKEDGTRSNRNGVSRRFLHEAYCEVVDAESPLSRGVESGDGH